MSVFVPVLNFDRTLDSEFANVADWLAQGQMDEEIAAWQGLITMDLPQKTDQKRLMDLGLMLLEQGEFEQRWLVSQELSNETKLFTQGFTVISAFRADFCIINFVRLLTQVWGSDHCAVINPLARSIGGS